MDAKHHLIVAHEVTNVASDRAQLSKMALAARESMGTTELHAIADRGYFSGAQIKDCEDAGIAVYVPKPMTSNAKAEGRFSKNDFIYIARDDEYQCPADQRAIYRYTSEEGGLQMRTYWSSACPGCPIKAQCTTSENRRIRRWEHVFGTLKHWMGSSHFLTRRLRNVGTEMSLQVLAYNLKRVIAILGIAKAMKAMRLVGA